MKLTRLKAGLLAAALLTVGSGIAFGNGMFFNLPTLGGAAYCALYAGDGVTCSGNVPAGPATFTGAELVPADTNLGSGQSPQTVRVPIVALGQGAASDVTSPATATIPANTPFYFLDGTQGSAFTITMPASPTEGYIQHVVCEAATSGTLTVAANSGQTLKGNPNAACTAGVGYNWRYQASNTTWYRF